MTAISVIDSAVNLGVLDDSDLDLVLALLPGRRGAVEARRRLAASQSLAESPLETRIRLIAADAGLAPHYLQHPIRNASGVLLGRADMAWDRPGDRLLVAEADGRGPHEQPVALFRDRRRANDFLGTGQVDMVRFTWQDTLTPAYVVSVLQQNLLGRS
jgi:hypothetical protein